METNSPASPGQPPAAAEHPPQSGHPLRLAAAYAIFGGAWILFSDRLLLALAPNLALFSEIGAWKGGAFVLVSAFVLYVAAGGRLLRPPVEDGRAGLGTGPLLLGFALAAIVVVVGGLAVLSHNAGRYRDSQFAQLRAVADLKVGQIESWLSGRRADAAMLRRSLDFGAAVQRWRQDGERGSGDIRERLEAMRAVYGYRSIFLADDRGRILVAAGDAPGAAAPPLLAVLRRAVAGGEVVDSDFYRDSGAGGRISLDFVAALPAAGAAPLSLVLQVDPHAYLYPLLSSWPVPSDSAETPLFRRDGERVLFLNDQRHRPGSGMEMSLPLAERRVLAVQVASGELAPGTAVEGVDYRGVPSLGVARRVAGTAWFLLAKVDKEELGAAARREVASGVVANLLLLGGLAVAVLLVLQRRQWREALVRQRAQADRLRALNLLDAIAENSADAIYATDLDGRYRLVNAAACGLLGHPRGEVLGREASGFFTPEDAARLRAFSRRAIAENRPGTVEMPLSTAVGRRDFLIAYGPLHDADGRPNGLFGVARDVTEGKAAEGRQKALNRALRLLGECSGAMVHASSEAGLLDKICRLIVDTGGYRMAWVGIAEADAARTVRPLAQAGFTGTYLAGAQISWADDAYDRGPAGTAIRSGRVQLIQNLAAHDDPGPWRELALQHGYQATIALPLSSGGKVFGALTIHSGNPQAFAGEEVELLGELAANLAFGIDMLRTRQQRAAAEERLVKLSLAVEQSPGGVIITDLDGRIEYVNAAFERDSGYRREDAIGRTPAILKSGLMARTVYEDLWRTIGAGRVWEGELINRRADGRLYPEFARIAPVRQPDGRISHYVSLQEDISEKKRVADELEQHRHHLEELVVERTAQLAAAKTAAEAANRAKSAFLANMSHEIRTPMNAVIGLTHLLLRASPTPQQAGRLAKIADAAQHLLSVINDILDLSKIEAGKLELEPGDFTVAEVCARVEVLVAERAAAKGLALAFEIDPALAGTWRGDALRLGQILVNFVGNAVKFTERGRVVCRVRLLGRDGARARVRCEVEDTGIGIAPEARGRLFQDFEQADASTTRKFGGTGLGLAISRRLVALMGGEAGVDSVLGEGSTFWFTVVLEGLPGHGAAPASGADAEGSLRREFAGCRVLLAEDEPVNQEIGRELIEDVGLRLDIAANGAEAVAMAAATDYDLILMDMLMPEMDGLAATRAIRALPGRAATPILAMTASAFEEDRRSCLDAGMNDHVAKPVEPERLFDAMVRWLRHRHRTPR